FSVTFYLPGVQDVVNLMIAFNRFCAICTPFAYRKSHTFVMIAFAMIYSIVFVFPIIGAFAYAVNIAPDSQTVPAFFVYKNVQVVLLKTLTPSLLLIATNDHMRKELM
ncbi:hypothetical protein PENTCL1PPCAC_7948, partial [Pristionchus entomophagus]